MYNILLPLKILYAWWSNSIYMRIDGEDIYIPKYPIRCHCNKPTIKIDTGDVFQYQCMCGNCGFAKYETKEAQASDG